MELLELVLTDGGRSNYFKGKNASDCVVRSIAIAKNLDYKVVYDDIYRVSGESPRNGVYTKRKNFKDYMVSLGFRWVPTSGIGSHQAVHFVDGELPQGTMICVVAKHWVCVKDNKVHDTFDSRYNSFGEHRRIYGYWILEK